MGRVVNDLMLSSSGASVVTALNESCIRRRYCTRTSPLTQVLTVEVVAVLTVAATNETDHAWLQDDGMSSGIFC